MSDKPQPNVRVKVTMDLYVADARHDEIDAKWAENPGYAAYQKTQLDDDSHQRVNDIVFEIVEAGDPEDAYNMTLVVDETTMLRSEE